MGRPWVKCMGASARAELGGVVPAGGRQLLSVDGQRMPQAHLTMPVPLSGNFTTAKMRMNWLSLT